MPSDSPIPTLGSGHPGLGAARRLLFVHAHPDDEASKGAATAARLSDDGARVTLVTCTGGEAGEVLNEALADLDLDTLPKVREAELAASVEVLGFAAAYLLGHLDSGWFEDLSEVPEGTFWATETELAAAQLAEILVVERPQVVVTYPEDGGYPHPDHIKVHLITMRAIELAVEHATAPWTVSRVYSSTVWTLDKMIAMDDEHERRGTPRVFDEWVARRSESGVLEPVADARIEVGSWLARRDAALIAHATQVAPDGPWFRHDREVERLIAPFEDFHLLAGTPITAPGPASDLFEGL